LFIFVVHWGLAIYLLWISCLMKAICQQIAEPGSIFGTPIAYERFRITCEQKAKQRAKRGGESERDTGCFLA